jgi:hypothetical protein
MTWNNFQNYLILYPSRYSVETLQEDFLLSVLPLGEAEPELIRATVERPTGYIVLYSETANIPL